MKKFFIIFIIVFTAVIFLDSNIALCREKIFLSRQDRKSVPVMVYSPGKNTCRGIAIISPGAGGSERGYSYLGDAMSTQGYLTVVVGHQESGLQVLRQKIIASGLRQGLYKLITDPEAYKGRFMDIAAARQWAQPRCNANEAILIGHSMGAATTMIEAGAKNILGVNGSNAFDAYIALSPQGVGSIFPPNAWQEISKPVLSITGTKDHELGGVSWKTRLDPFNNMSSGCKWLGVIDGATHMNFAGTGVSAQTKNLTVKTIQAFLSGIHQHNCKPPKPEKGIEIKVK